MHGSALELWPTISYGNPGNASVLNRLLNDDDAAAKFIADAIAAVDGGERKEPWLLPVPIGVFDGIVGAIKWVYDLTGSDQVRDAWELGKIGRYYAVEDMLTTAEAERYGAMSLREHYENVAKNGQEYDPYTTVFAKNPLIK